VSQSEISHTTSYKWLQLIIVLVGLIVFILLFFADKTHLENPTIADISVGTIPDKTRTAGEGLPPLAPDNKLDKWVNILNRSNETEKPRLLDSIIVSLQSRKRFAYASDYANELIKLDSSLQNRLLAGELSYQATKLDFIQADSSLFRRYSNRSLTNLKKVVAQAPENDRALLTLGLAYIESGVAQNSMMGIQTIRKVLEINPQNADASFHLGMFSIQTGQYDKAKERFEEVLRLRPDDHQAKFQLAYSLAQLGDILRAKLMLQEVIGQTKDTQLKVLAQNLFNSLALR